MLDDVAKDNLHAVLEELRGFAPIGMLE